MWMTYYTISTIICFTTIHNASLFRHFYCVYFSVYIQTVEKLWQHFNRSSSTFKMTNFIFLFFALIFNCATNVLPCGPGSGTSRGRIREHNIKGNRLPNVPETSHAASGTFEGVKHRTDPRLVSLLSTDIVFEDKSYNAASRMSIKVF